MAHPQIAAFARLADGNTPPVRKIEGQKTLLGRTMHAIAYDPVRDEFVVPHEFAQAILTFRGGANGEEPPLRVIQGPKTQLGNFSRLGLDPIHGEIFVPLRDSVLVFSREANGDVAPLRILGGPDTGLGASAVAVDPIRNLLVVSGGGQQGGGTFFRIFDRTAQGNTKPLRVIGGPKSGLRNLGGPFAVLPSTGKIIATVRGRSGELASDEAFAAVWNITDDGDVPPQYVFGGPQGILRMPRGVAIDERHKSVIVTDKRLNSIITFYFPEIF